MIQPGGKKLLTHPMAAILLVLLVAFTVHCVHVFPPKSCTELMQLAFSAILLNLSRNLSQM